MVLSNKKLKQKLRAKFDEINASKTLKTPELETPKSLKQLLDSKTPTPRLSKREKRRENLNFSPINGENKDTHVKEEGSRVEKRKREKMGVENGGEIEGNNGEIMSERLKEKKRIKMERRSKNEDLVKEGGDLKKEVKQKENVILKVKMKKKKKKNYKKKSKKIEVEKVEVENGGISNDIVANTSEANDDEDDKKKVYVGGMPYSSTEDDIWNYFDQCGALTDIDCLKFPDSGKFRGIAIISFKTEEAAKKAMALDGSDMEGLYLKIQPYKTTRTPKTTNFSPPVIEGYNRIYAGNLSWDITEDDLRKLFSDCNISSIRFGEDKETGEFKGYAHVDFSDSDSLTKALKLDQKVVCGRPVKVSRAVPAKGPLRNPISASTPAAVKPQEVSIGVKTFTPQENNSAIMAVAPQENASGLSLAKLKRRTCYECGEKGHISSECKVIAAIKPEEMSSGATAVAPQENNGAIMAVTPQENTTAVSAGKLKRRTCYECGEKGHISSECRVTAAVKPQEISRGAVAVLPVTPQENNSAMLAVAPQENATAVSTGKLKRRTCYECGEKGHISSECRVTAAVKPQEISSGAVTVVSVTPQENKSAIAAVKPQENATAVSTGKLKRRTCYECGEKGHISSACPKKQATEQN